MGVLNIQISQAGLSSVVPGFIYINTNDTFATVTTANYLNNVASEGFSFSNNQMALVQTTDDGVVLLQVSVSGSNVSLVEPAGPGNVTLPTIANRLIVSTNTAGQLANLTGTAVNGGSLQAGLSGTAGSLISYPSTASKGSLRVTAVANSGDTITTLSNASMGQASVITIPDPANALGRLLIGATATPFVSGNFPVASGTAGLMVDSGVAATNLVSKTAANTFSGSGQIILAKANGTEASNLVTASGNAGVITTSSLSTAGGSSYAITWTNTLITSTSVILLSIMGGTNTTQNIKITATAGSGTSTLTIYNLTAATALNGTIFIGYTVL